MKKNRMFNLSIFMLVLALLCSTMTPAFAAYDSGNVNPVYDSVTGGNANESLASNHMTLPSDNSSDNPMPSVDTLPDSATGGDTMDDSSASAPSDSNSSGSETASSPDGGSESNTSDANGGADTMPEPGPGPDDGVIVLTHRDDFYGLDATHITDRYFYWTEWLLDETPTLVHNTATGKYYLQYHLNTASKIVYLYYDHEEAFGIGRQLSYLDEMNDVQHTIWTKLDWRHAEATGSMLSRATVDAMNKLDGLDAETALNFIMTRPEYATNDTLKMWVGYDLAVIRSYQSKVADGVKDLLTTLRLTGAGKDIPASLIDFLSLENPTAAQVSAAAHELMETYPVVQNLVKFNDVRLTMPASRTLCIQNLDADVLDELYNGVKEAAKVFWPIDAYQVERISYSVPIPAELVDVLPIEEVPAPKPEPIPDFPITATGGEDFDSGLPVSVTGGEDSTSDSTATDIGSAFELPTTSVGE